VLILYCIRIAKEWFFVRRATGVGAGEKDIARRLRKTPYLEHRRWPVKRLLK